MPEVLENPTAEGSFYFLTADHIRWEAAPSGPGDVFRLYVDPADSIEARLVRYAAGSVTGGAPELLGPEVYVLSGEFEADGEHLAQGDFHAAVGASVCGETKKGCVLFTLRETSPSAGTGEAPDGGATTRASTVRVAERRWTHTGFGVRYKRLAHDPVHHVEITLVQMDPGASYPAHRYVGAEELFVVRGDCLCEGHRLARGDYHHSVAGAFHRPAASENGCEFILVRHGVPD